MTPTPVPEVFLRLALAAALGGAIGLEREYRRKPAGLRTNILIALGSALFSVLSFELGSGAGSPDRIAAQIVTGIGFLGAGAILRSGASVHGLTTAATIWVNAAIGMAAGLGSYTRGRQRGDHPRGAGVPAHDRAVLRRRFPPRGCDTTRHCRHADLWRPPPPTGDAPTDDSRLNEREDR
jgi:MgtC family protein